MAHLQRNLLLELCRVATGSVSANVLAPPTQIDALLRHLLGITPEVNNDVGKEPDMERKNPDDDRARYFVQSISFGKLCNTSVDDPYARRAIEDLVKRVLGARAAVRFSELRNIKSGWDFGKGEALGEGTLNNLSALLSRVRNPPPSVRLFLSADGSLEIQWKSRDGNRISVFARNDGFEVFRAEQDEELAFPDSDLQGVLLAAGVAEPLAA